MSTETKSVLLKNLEEYFAKTTPEQRKKDWDRIVEETKDIKGPTVDEYLRGIHQHSFKKDITNENTR